MRILVIEDELAMRTALITLLRAEGYLVTSAADGERGLEQALEEQPDLILLDIMLPSLDGFSICQELRKRHFAAPILMLTAKGFVDDRVRGLDAGADDYLLKPFSQKELLARVRALSRRRDQGETALQQTCFGNVVLDFTSERCTRAGALLELTVKEFRMLRLLAEANGKPVSRQQFLDLVWEYNAYPTTRTIDTHMAGLRAKLEPNPAEPRYLLTVHRVGYRLVLEE
jgi:DNA-binding response OmpR family regulator